MQSVDRDALQKKTLRVLVAGQVVAAAALSVAPIWVAGLSVKMTLIYLTILSGILLAVRQFWPIVRTRLVSLFVGLIIAVVMIQVESDSLVTSATRLILIGFIFLVFLVFGNPKFFRIAAINVFIFLLFFALTEIGFRFISDPQDSSQYEAIELFRNDRIDGPGKRSDVEIHSDKSGQRVTTDQPKSSSGRILIFGGSTTFCGEVADNETYPSQLQRSVIAAGFNMRVENYGKSAATATDRVEILRGITDLKSNDIVIFYVGVNEAGVGFTQRDVPVQLIRKLPELSTALQKASSYSRIADVLFRNLVFGGVSVTDESKDNAVAQFDMALREAETLTQRSGARFVPILQANLFTKTPRSEYDRDLGSMYGSELEPVVVDLYARMIGVVKSFELSGDATDVMNSLKVSPYFDWHHVDVNGNRQIARYIFDLLLDRNLLK
ncbi:MAG: SGNH/GDSL hydrolase family protein [Actinobacteria bacterium]|nr:SGNH/GDSL hydrolase family protein [Actinomycetota bacterium]